MGLDRVELSTSRLSGVRSNHLSYRPFTFRNLKNDNNIAGGKSPGN